MTATNTATLSGSMQTDVLNPGFWASTFPYLSVNQRTGAHLHNLPAPHRQPLERIHARMALEGYFGDEDATLGELAPPLADAVKGCVGMGLPPVFIFLFDEVWESFFRLHAVIASLLGEGYRLLPDFWAWHIDPTKQQSGWQPHRDKGSRSLAADGTPLSLTLWIPLSDANPLNGCMYIVPANHDLSYRKPNEAQLQVAVPHIRALPAKPGDYLCWNQCVYHWGAASSPFATEPRMSMALEFQRGDTPPFNMPLLKPLVYPDFPARLRLVAKQILQYQHMYGFSRELQDMAYKMASVTSSKP